MQNPAAHNAHQRRRERRYYFEQAAGAYGFQVPHDINSFRLHHPNHLPNLASNPVQRPSGAAFGAWFDLSATASGAKIIRLLGDKAAVAREAEHWAPITSALFDLTGYFAAFLAHPDVPDALRAHLVAWFVGLSKTADAAAAQFGVLRAKAVHDSQGRPAAAGLQTAIELAGTAGTYQTGIEKRFYDQFWSRVEKETVKRGASASTSKRNRGKGKPRGREQPAPQPAAAE
ncbi:MAG: hypothetical protein Aurels2KO_57350 [Aureliella sp.]